jgi:uncharacterized protein with beta-barrel porin domain
LNGAYDVHSTYLLAARGLGGASKLAVLVSTDNGTATASGFSSRTTGQSVGLGFGADFGGAKLDLGFTTGTGTSSGARNGQTFSNAKSSASTVMARLTVAPIGGFSPFVGLSRSLGSMDGFAEAGSGANLNVQSFNQTINLAEVGADYAVKLSGFWSMGLTLAYEHNLGGAIDTVSSTFADAATPTTFSVATYGFGKDQLRGAIGFKAALSELSSAGFSYEIRSGNGVKAASELKLNYTRRF